MVEKELIVTAAGIVRGMSKDVDQRLIRPIGEGFNASVMISGSFAPKTLVEGICIWQTREAYVTLFSHIADFDADTFRLCCLPENVELPPKLCPQCGEDVNHFSQRIRGGHSCYPSKG